MATRLGHAGATVEDGCPLPTTCPLPFERQLPTSRNALRHVAEARAVLEAQRKRAAVVMMAYEKWAVIEAKSSADRSIGEDFFVEQMRHMECKYGLLSGRALDSECAAWVAHRVEELSKGIPPTDWKGARRSMQKAAGEARRKQNKLLLAEARAQRVRLEGITKPLRVEQRRAKALSRPVKAATARPAVDSVAAFFGNASIGQEPR